MGFTRCGRQKEPIPSVNWSTTDVVASVSSKLRKVDLRRGVVWRARRKLPWTVRMGKRWRHVVARLRHLVLRGSKRPWG